MISSVFTARPQAHAAAALAISGLAAVILAGCTAPPASLTCPTGTETIRVGLAGINPDAPGTVNVALWSSAETFMKDKEWYRGTNIPARDAGKGVVFENVAPGTYAISAFHDRTDSGKLRRGLFGLPIDPWAISNGGAPLAPPSWERAKFVVGTGVTNITLTFNKSAEKPR